MSVLERLPSDAFFNVLMHLSPADKGQLSQINKNSKRIIQESVAQEKSAYAVEIEIVVAEVLKALANPSTHAVYDGIQREVELLKQLPKKYSAWHLPASYQMEMDRHQIHVLVQRIANHLFVLESQSPALLALEQNKTLTFLGPDIKRSLANSRKRSAYYSRLVTLHGWACDVLHKDLEVDRLLEKLPLVVSIRRVGNDTCCYTFKHVCCDLVDQQRVDEAIELASHVPPLDVEISHVTQWSLYKIILMAVLQQRETLNDPQTIQRMSLLLHRMSALMPSLMQEFTNKLVDLLMKRGHLAMVQQLAEAVKLDDASPIPSPQTVRESEVDGNTLASRILYRTAIVIAKTSKEEAFALAKGIGDRKLQISFFKEMARDCSEADQIQGLRKVFDNDSFDLSFRLHGMEALICRCIQLSYLDLAVDYLATLPDHPIKSHLHFVMARYYADMGNFQYAEEIASLIWLHLEQSIIYEKIAKKFAEDADFDRALEYAALAAHPSIRSQAYYFVGKAMLEMEHLENRYERVINCIDRIENEGDRVALMKTMIATMLIESGNHYLSNYLRVAERIAEFHQPEMRDQLLHHLVKSARGLLPFESYLTCANTVRSMMTVAHFKDSVFVDLIEDFRYHNMAVSHEEKSPN